MTKPTDRLQERAALVALWVTLGCVSVVYGLMRLSAGKWLKGATPLEMIAGTAATPFQYRDLIPFLYRKLFALWPALADSLQTLTAITEAVFHFAALGVAALYLRRRGASGLAATLGALL